MLSDNLLGGSMISMNMFAFHEHFPLIMIGNRCIFTMFAPWLPNHSTQIYHENRWNLIHAVELHQNHLIFFKCPWCDYGISHAKHSPTGESSRLSLNSGYMEVIKMGLHNYQLAVYLIRGPHLIYDP